MSRLCAASNRKTGEANSIASNIRDFDNTITVLVGPEEKRFSVHEDAICDKSKFFKAACRKCWIEGRERLVRLPEHKADVFQDYCKWVYSGVISTTLITPLDSVREKTAEETRFIDLYLLGDSLDDVQLRNLATQGFCRSLEAGNSLPSPTGYATIWSSTPSGSLFRKQLVDMVLLVCGREDIAATIAQYPPEFVQELAIATSRKVPVVTWAAATGDNKKYLELEEPKVNTA